MRIITCDRCGVTLDKDPSGFVMVDINGKPFGANPFYKMDFCDKCRDEIIAFGKMKPKKAAAPETPEAPKKAPPLNRGKIFALRKANWSLSEIAKEMNCSVGTVSKICTDMLQKEQAKKKG